MMRTVLAALVVLAALPGQACGETIGGIGVGQWESAAHSAKPTDCDRLAAYAPDRDAVSPPVAHEQVDLPAAIAACRRAIAGEPTNPRFHYQIARLLGYAGDEAAARNERLIAAGAGYPAALFVLGYQRAFARTGADRCGGAALMRRAADSGAFAGQVGLASYVVDGSFAGCAAAGDKAVLTGFLAKAKSGARGYFEELLVASLGREVARLP